MLLLKEGYQHLVNYLSTYGNIIVLLSDDGNHNYYYFTDFMGANRSNIGSIEHNQFSGIDITEFISRNVGGSINAKLEDKTLSNIYSTFLESKKAVNVKFNGIPYITFTT